MRIVIFLALTLTLLPGSAAGAPDKWGLSGNVGHRQSRDEAVANLQAMERIDTRINSRVQSRVRNRLDRYYDPKANAESPFKIAGEQARIAGRPRLR